MDESIYMLNALWFKRDDGQEKYQEYGVAVSSLIAKAGAEINQNYAPEQALIGEWDPDIFFLVKYPSQSAFETMIASSEYKEISHLREAAIEKSMLIRCKPFDWD